MSPRPHIAVALLAVLCSCAPIGPFVWADDYVVEEPKPEDAAYRIAPGDVLQVRVYSQDGLSGRERVREDGKLSIPLLQDVPAAGLTPTALAEQIQLRLKALINAPVVTISVVESRPVQVSVLGEVVRPGRYTFEPGMGVLEGLALAGGPSEFAHHDCVFVLRRQEPVARIRFTFEALSRGLGRGSKLRLKAGDTIVVE